MSISKKAKQIAKNVQPEEGWFHDPSATDDIELSAQVLLDEGLSSCMTETVIKAVIITVRNEYGD